MVRWGQAPFSPAALEAAMAVFQPGLYDAALGPSAGRPPASDVGAFAGPAFDPADVAGHLRAFEIGRWKA